MGYHGSLTKCKKSHFDIPTELAFNSFLHGMAFLCSTFVLIENGVEMRVTASRQDINKHLSVPAYFTLATMEQRLEGITVTWHYCDAIMGAIASQITSLTIAYSIVYSDTDQRKHQSSASLAFVRGSHREPVNSPHKWPVTRKMSPFDDVTMEQRLEEVTVNDATVYRRDKFNSFPPGQNGRHIADDIFRCVFVDEKFGILIKFHRSLFLRVQLTITQHSFRKWLGAE